MFAHNYVLTQSSSNCSGWTIFLGSSHAVLLDLYVLENCTHGDFRKQITGVDKSILIQYCHGGDWHYLCCGGPRWTSTLATVACRQLGYSNEGG